MNELAPFKELLHRFFDKGYIIPDSVVALAFDYLFAGGELPELDKNFAETLFCLKDICEINKFGGAQDLIDYYQKKHDDLDILANRLMARLN